MSTAAFTALSAAMLVAAAYAHLRIPRFSATRSGVMLARGVLVLVGVAFGLVAANYYASPELPAALVFASGFGFAHVPAALILMLKRQRGEPPS
jgi:hypothetical protein